LNGKRAMDADAVSLYVKHASNITFR